MLPALLAVLALANEALGHCQMKSPPPFLSQFGPTFNEQIQAPFSMTNPLNLDGSDSPCKGYANLTDSTKPVATLVAGKSITVTIDGTATHGGGSCQWGLSYDQGKTFMVTHSAIGGCPLKPTWTVPIPAGAPAAAKALFFWNWHNFSGNREQYQNCAVVKVQSQATEPFTAPAMFVANVFGPDECRTIEGKNYMYPNPGPSVEYANGMSPSSPKTVLKPCSVNQSTFITVSADGKIVTKGSPASSSGSSSGSSSAASPKPSKSKPKPKTTKSTPAVADNKAVKTVTVTKTAQCSAAKLRRRHAHRMRLPSQS